MDDAFELENPAPRRDEFALALFDGLQVIHLLGAESRGVLKGALALEETKLPRSEKKFYPAALELARALAGLELCEEDEQTLIAILGLRKHIFKPKRLSRQGLSPEQMRQALTLTALVEIADALARAKGETRLQQVEVCDTGPVVVLAAPAGEEQVKKARPKMSLWKKLGYAELQFLTPEEAELWLAPFPQPAENSGLLPGDTLAEAGRKTMRFLFAQMLSHEEGTRLGEDIEALHDMRVATRRLRAAFEVFDQAFRERALKPHLKGLRTTGRALGTVRDMDVFMEKAQRYIQTLPEEKRPGLDPLLEHWREQREESRKTMLEHLNSLEYARFKRNFNIFLNTPGAGELLHEEDLIAPRLVRQLVPLLVYERMASVRAFETYLEDAPIERLHMLRIEIKKLRYTLEYFREALGKRAAEAISDLKILQDHLGDLHDAQVAAQILSDFIEAWEIDSQYQPTQERQSIEEVVSYLAARHKERLQLLASFDAAWRTHFRNKTFRQYIAQAVSVL
jgi:CHAD domain-containing protein